MTSYPEPLMYDHFSLSANNGESSQAPQLKLKSNKASPIIKTEDLHPYNPYLAAAMAGPSHTNVTNPYGAPDTWAKVLDNMVTPLPKEELIDQARVAQGLLLRAQAEALPHYHYPSSDFTYLSTTTSKTYASTPSILASTSDVRFALSNEHRNSPSTIKRVATPFYAPARLKRKSNRITKAKRDLPAIQKRNKLARLEIFTKTFHCPSVVARAPGDARPLIKFYSKRVLNPKRPCFFKKRFLAGPPEKTEVGDNRIFYVKECLCADLM